MSFSINLPPGLAGLFASLVHGGGELVTVLPAAGGGPVQLKASVQSPRTDNLFNDADQEGFVVYISPTDLPAGLDKFDRIEIRGVTRAVHECHAVEAGGSNLMWMVKVLG